MIRDISQARKVQTALKESEERYAAIVNNAPEPVLIHHDGKVLFINQAAQETFGYTCREMYSTNIITYLSPESKPYIQQMIQDRENNDDILEYEANFVHKNGTLLTLIIRGTKIIYQNQSAVLIHLTDITKRKQIEQALYNANKQLNLMTNITRHDILNGVTGLLGYLELAEEDPSLFSSLSIQKTLKTITLKIQEQIEFTRDYQTIGLNEPSWQNLNTLLNGLHPPEGIALTSPACQYEVYADLLLEKVFHNLLDNSIRHGQTVTEISVSCIEESNRLKVIYTDNGIGILPQEKEIAFTSGWGKNTGYGLFLMREILAITGSTIKETGIYGQGARFEILISRENFRRIHDDPVL